MSFEDIDDTTEEHEKRIVRCRACQARIIFLQSANDPDKRVPVDADTVEPEDVIYEHGRHESHFRTCTDPGRFSKGRPR